jgi:hypothetical protein
MNSWIETGLDIIASSVNDHIAQRRTYVNWPNAKLDGRSDG